MGYYIKLIDQNSLKIVGTSGDIKIELIELNKNYAPYNWTINAGFEYTFNLKPHQIDRIHIVHNKTELHIYSIVDNQLVKLEYTLQSDFNMPFVCFTGHSGGGTSIVVKSLKHFGLHFGDDSGDFSNRKAHESVAMRTFIDKVLINEDARILKSYSKALESYRYKKNQVNAFKITDLEIKPNLANGIGLSKLFNDIKFVSVVKPQKGTGISKEGIEFNSKSDLDIYINQHPKVQAPIFHLDFNKYFKDYNYFNEVLEFIGLSIRINKGDFDNMLDSIKFDPKVLK